MNIDMELFRQLYKMCQYIFDNESEFMNKYFSHYQVLDEGNWHELQNVSFSGKRCHVVLRNIANNGIVAEDVDVMDVLDWMEK